MHAGPDCIGTVRHCGKQEDFAQVSKEVNGAVCIVIVPPSVETGSVELGEPKMSHKCNLAYT